VTFTGYPSLRPPRRARRRPPVKASLTKTRRGRSLLRRGHGQDGPHALKVEGSVLGRRLEGGGQPRDTDYLGQAEHGHEFAVGARAGSQELVPVAGDGRLSAGDHGRVSHRPGLVGQDRQVVFKLHGASPWLLPLMDGHRALPVSDLDVVPEGAEQKGLLGVDRGGGVYGVVVGHKEGLVHPDEAVPAGRKAGRG